MFKKIADISFKKNNAHLGKKLIFHFELTAILLHSSGDQKVPMENLKNFGCGWACLTTPNRNIRLRFILS